MQEKSISDDFDVYDTDDNDSVVEGEWTCYECPYQNEIIITSPVSIGDIVECEICRTKYKVVF